MKIGKSQQMFFRAFLGALSFHTSQERNFFPKVLMQLILRLEADRRDMIVGNLSQETFVLGLVDQRIGIVEVAPLLLNLIPESPMLLFVSMIDDQEFFIRAC